MIGATTMGSAPSRMALPLVECDNWLPDEFALADRASIGIHVDGANIGAVSRRVLGGENGAISPFVSGYSHRTRSNLWDRSAKVRAAMGR